MDIDKVCFKKIEIDESMASRRFRAGTRGRVKPYKKRMSHIKIVLSDEVRVESKVKSVRVEKKIENKAEEVKVEDKKVNKEENMKEKEVIKETK